MAVCFSLSFCFYGKIKFMAQIAASISSVSFVELGAVAFSNGLSGRSCGAVYIFKFKDSAEEFASVLMIILTGSITGGNRHVQ